MSDESKDMLNLHTKAALFHQAKDVVDKDLKDNLTMLFGHHVETSGENAKYLYAASTILHTGE